MDGEELGRHTETINSAESHSHAHAQSTLPLVTDYESAATAAPVAELVPALSSGCDVTLRHQSVDNLSV